jgi:hypothetical protein
MNLPKVYLDNCVVSNEARSNLQAHPDEMAAVRAIYTAKDAGKIEIITSDQTTREQDRWFNEVGRKMLKEARSKLQMIDDHRQLAGHAVYDQHSGSTAMVLGSSSLDQHLHNEFRGLRLSDDDAQHLVNAVHEGCDWFVTTDFNDFRDRRVSLELHCRGLKIVWPTELVEKLGL